MQNQDDLRNALEEAFTEIAGASGDSLSEFAQLQEQRVGRFKATEEHLKSTLGADHPEVLAVGIAAKETEELRDALLSLAK